MLLVLEDCFAECTGLFTWIAHESQISIQKTQYKNISLQCPPETFVVEAWSPTTGLQLGLHMFSSSPARRHPL